MRYIEYYSRTIAKVTLLMLFLCVMGCSRHKDDIPTMSMNTMEVSVDYENRPIPLELLEGRAKRVIVMADNALCVVAALNCLDRVVALDKKTKDNLPLTESYKIRPQLKDLPDIGKTSAPNYEAIIALSPDVIFLKGNAKMAMDMENKTGAKVVCIKSIGGFDFNIYSLIGTILGEEERAYSIMTYLEDKMISLEGLLDSAITNGDIKKKSAYVVIQNARNSLFKTMKYQQSLELARIDNVAALGGNSDEWGFIDVSKEELIKWNPSIILLDMPISENSITKGDLYGDDTLCLLEGVSSGQIYLAHTFLLPKDYAFVIANGYYYAHIAYPNIITQSIYQNTIDEIFATVYGFKEGYYGEWEGNLK